MQSPLDPEYSDALFRKISLRDKLSLRFESRHVASFITRLHARNTEEKVVKEEEEEEDDDDN